MKLYAVGAIEQERNARFLDKEFPIVLSWADDMYGVMPVFKTLEAAEKYANGRFEIIEITTMELAAEDALPN